MPKPASWVRASLILVSEWIPIASDLRIVSLPALEEQLVASHLEEEAARLRGFIIAKDHEWAVVAGIQQGVNVALATM
jgi:hypothetical protein